MLLLPLIFCCTCTKLSPPCIKASTLFLVARECILFLALISDQTTVYVGSKEEQSQNARHLIIAGEDSSVSENQFKSWGQNPQLV